MEGGNSNNAGVGSPERDKTRDSVHETTQFLPQEVNDAVEIAAGRKNVGQKPMELKKKNPSNLLCYLYWLLVICILCLISFTIWLSIQLARRHNMAMLAQGGRAGGKQPFTFDDVFNSSYQPKSYSVNWIKDSDSYVYRSSDGSLMKYDISTNTTQKLVDKTIFEELQTSSYYISYDAQFVLLRYDIKSKWRHSFTAKYKVYDTLGKTRESKLINFPSNDSFADSPLQYAVWAPSSHTIVFAYNNNLYYQDTPTSDVKQLTYNGDEKFIFNGVADWLYEEEILGTHIAHWWSTNSRYLCYAKFNDTKVPLFRFPYYGPKTDVYGDLIEFAYPKAGDLSKDSNTKATLHVVDIDNPLDPHKQITPPSMFANEDHYFTRVAWLDNNRVLVVWANRVQNRSMCRVCDLQNGAACIDNHYESVMGGWIEPGLPVKYLADSNSYATILPLAVGGTGTWPHLATVSIPTDTEGVVIHQITGQFETKAIVGYESTRQYLYYLATDGDPKKRHLYRIKASSGLQTGTCLSCNVSADCQYVSASFSSTGRYYILGCLGPGVPVYTLRDTNGTLNVVKEDNAELKSLLSNKLLPIREFMEVPIGDGYKGWAEVYIPPLITEEDEKTKRFPLLVHTYGGPGSQKVTERFSIGWHTYLASSQEIVYGSLDGRGTTSRGDKFKHLLYRKMATLEMEDQLLGGLFFKELEYVDPAKAAIWGWSYGGFLTSHVVANETAIFPCGISGAALLDRRYYDTAHSERYMGLATPDDNEVGYERTDLTKKIEHFRDKKYLMVHGTADDNVHFASSAQLVKALTDAEIQFRFQLYTDLNHYFLGRSRHLYQLFTNFLKEDCYSYFWKHETKSWIVDKAVKKERFRIKQFCI